MVNQTTARIAAMVLIALPTLVAIATLAPRRF